MCLLPPLYRPRPTGSSGMFPGLSKVLCGIFIFKPNFDRATSPNFSVGFQFLPPISTERPLPTFVWDFLRVNKKHEKIWHPVRTPDSFFSCFLSFLRHRGLSSEAAQQPYRSLFPHDVFLSGAAFTRFFFYSFRSRYSAASALPFRKDGISGYSAGSVSPSRSFHTAAPAAVTRSATVCTPRTSRSSGSAA